MHLNQLIILNCESRKELDNIQHAAAFLTGPDGIEPAWLYAATH